jgi:hypothetical protein
MPRFTNKIETAHDVNKIRHLLKSNKKMTQILWELSLRPELYINNPKKPKSGLETTKNREAPKLLTEVKNKN